MIRHIESIAKSPGPGYVRYMGADEALVLTRRRALQAGAAGAAAAFLVTSPWAAKAVAAAEGGAGYLVRSSWAGVSDPMFAVGNTTLRLEGVADLPAAANVASLRDSEDAFALIFSGHGVGQLDAGIHQIRHREMGSFYMYVGQVGAPGDERLEVVVNRVTPRRAASGSRVETSRSAGERVGAATAANVAAEKSAIRSVTVKRGKRGARAVAKLDAGADVRELTAWLYRGDRVVAATTRKVKRSRVEFTLKGAKRLRKGSYEVALMATDAGGERSYKRKPIKLR